VIDNGCQDEIRELTERILPNARYVPERRPGLDFARNRALSEVTSEIIAFLDDDAVADAFWVRSIAECFASFPRAAAVTGLTLPLELETEAQELFEANGGFAPRFTRTILPGDGKRLFRFRLPLVVSTSDVGTG
jgi:glycosyltransferase involved in cell wall biosynthesis